MSGGCPLNTGLLNTGLLNTGLTVIENNLLLENNLSLPSQLRRYVIF